RENAEAPPDHLLPPFQTAFFRKAGLIIPRIPKMLTAMPAQTIARRAPVDDANPRLMSVIKKPRRVTRSPVTTIFTSCVPGWSNGQTEKRGQAGTSRGWQSGVV